MGDGFLTSEYVGLPLAIGTGGDASLGVRGSVYKYQKNAITIIIIVLVLFL